MLQTLLGVDGGGTRTRAVLLEASSPPHSSELQLREMGRGEAPSCNHYSVGWGLALQNLLSAVSQAFHAANALSTEPG